MPFYSFFGLPDSSHLPDGIFSSYFHHPCFLSSCFGYPGFDKLFWTCFSTLTLTLTLTSPTSLIIYKKHPPFLLAIIPGEGHLTVEGMVPYWAGLYWPK